MLIFFSFAADDLVRKLIADRSKPPLADEEAHTDTDRVASNQDVEAVEEFRSGCYCWQPQNLLILSTEKLKDPARITKSSRRDPHGRRQLMRVNSANVLDEGLWIGGKVITRDSGSEIGTRCTQVHVPTVKDRYILLAI
jgi:hypothetical protein